MVTRYHLGRPHHGGGDVRHVALQASGAEANLDLTAPNNGWPALDYEEVQWRLSDELRGAVPIQQVIRLEARPYQAAIPPTIADLDPLAELSPASIEQAADAAAQILMFDREVAALPVPMPAVLLRTESASSSQIEHLTANSRNLATAAIGITAGQNADLVADNVAATTSAVTGSGDLTREHIHHTLMERSEPDIAGHFRREPVWIGRPNLSPHGADFIPPRWERINDFVDDLTAFSRRRELNAIVLAAITHAQFETIHPFVDGSGRTGRAIVHTLLKNTGHAMATTVPVSSGLLGDVNGHRLANDTTRIHEDWRARIRARSDSGAWRLADHLFAQPVVNSGHVARFLGSSPQGAFNAIGTLVDAGVLTQTSRDRRNQLWQAKDVLDAMDDFAARATRRGL